MSTRTMRPPPATPADAPVERLFEGVPLLIGVVETTEDDILHCSDNAAARRFFGGGPTAGRWASELGVTTEARREWLGWYARARATGQPAHFEHAHPGGWFSVYVSYLGEAPSGRPSFSYVAEDATARRRAEEERERARRALEDTAAALAALNATLEERVADRTAELAAANEELRAFSWSVSHDLRAPLRAIDGYAALLAGQEPLSAAALAQIGRIRSSSKRMEHLIDALLDLARIGRMEIHRGQVDLGAIAAVVVAELHRVEPERFVEFRVAPDLEVVGDERLLHLVVQNLLGNAWKYTRPRPVAHVEIGRDGDIFFVRDDGVGFDMRYAGQLFKPFHRLHRPGEFEGSGVGLATVARIVRRHGGDIWAEAAPDRGATFSFTLDPVSTPGSTRPGPDGP